MALFPSLLFFKGRQILSFYKHTRTPYDLTLDCLKIKQSPFLAISNNGLKLSLLPRSGESFTFYENMIERVYLRNEITLQPGSTVVDIGANIGAFAILAASAVGPHGRVIAFEPITNTFKRLLENVALNNFENVECNRAAIDSKNGEIILRFGKKSAYATAHSVHIGGGEQTIETAPCFTLERIFTDCRINRINLLKVDCEGSEYGIFETLSSDTAARIDQIAMEVHQVEGASADHLKGKLAMLGFSVHTDPIWTAFNTAGKCPS
jgi:FkbM family methyltransferase